MRFSIRDIFWMTALVAMAMGWRLDAWRRDWTTKSAQMRKDYYNLMSDLARSEAQKMSEAKRKYQELAGALQRESDAAEKRERAAATETHPTP